MNHKESPRYIAALFDLDGVLIDTEGAYTKFWDEMASKHDKPSTFAYDIKGTTLSSILDTHFPAELHEEIENMVHDYENNMEFVLFPGVEKFINGLIERGVKMAIVTSSDDSKVNSLKKQLPNLTEAMNVIIDGSMVNRSKPHPEGYLMAATKLGVKPSRCVVFEDSLQGLESGRRAGAKVVGLITTNPAEKVLPLSDISIMSFEEITPEEIGF